MRKLSRTLSISAIFCMALSAAAAQNDTLTVGFTNPPDTAKPQTWWHWMNGNITKAGITADLEAMKKIGLGGATIVNVDCDIPTGPVKFMSDEWREDFKFAVSEANRLGLKLCVENCAGWSSSGGPWNTPEHGMQRLTAIETQITGGKIFDEDLKQPAKSLNVYHDIALLAFPSSAPTGNSTTTAPAKIEIAKAFYESLDGSRSLDVKNKIDEAIRSGKKSIGADTPELGGDPAPGEYKRLRVELLINGKPDSISVDENDILILPTNAGELAIAKKNIKNMVDRTFVRPPKVADVSGSEVVPTENVIDLTEKMSPEGHLKWDAPAGNWTLLRIGYTPIGIKNHPSPKEGLGLECDKMSKSALDAHWAGFMQKVLDDIGPLAGKSLDASLIDSYEVGLQDWTPAFRDEFKKRRGYDPIKYLPTFTRHTVQSPEITERFLWDMRRTVADLFAENYFGHFNELCHQHGLASAIEPYTGPFESLQCGAPADVVMGEFWTGSNGHPSIKMCASIAHIYGKSIVGAESFTADTGPGKWQSDPYSLKTLGDLMFCQGLNRYIFHRYAMQPWTDRFPGMTMGPWGLHFERTLTWWNQGKAWIDYISRCEFLLQQGRAVADVAYFTGESAPVEMRTGQPVMPRGYDFDAINADVLLNGATVKDGRITLPSGASYSVLVLPRDDANLTPKMLAKLRDLVNDGATLDGPRPQHSPSLADYPNCDKQVKEIADSLWANWDGKSVFEASVGKGRVIMHQPLEQIFATQKLSPDFSYAGESKDTHLEFTHRIADGNDIYFVSNQRRVFDSADCTFRATGKSPQLWHSDTGVIEPAPVWNDLNGKTTVHLSFDPAGSVFVIFTPDSPAAHLTSITAATGKELAAPKKLEIQHAIYGASGSEEGLDVTAVLKQSIKENRLVYTVDNKTFGKDPAVMQGKELRVDYTLDGKPQRATVFENDTIALPPIPSIGDSPQYEALAVDGSLSLKFWSNTNATAQTVDGKALQIAAGHLPAPAVIEGAWQLSFPPNWGAPSSVPLDHLISWTSHPDPGVRYFSGTATYAKQIEIAADRFASNRELWLDLGEVKNIAEVAVNGHNLGVLWKPPFRVNITAAAKPGTNALEIKITNLWPNRLIGDEQLPADVEWRGDHLKAWPQWLLDGKPSPTGRLTFTTWHHWKKDSKLIESGLLGPVTLESADIVAIR